MAGTYGLSGSGINVDSVVSQLMGTERGPYNKMAQQQQQLTWKKEAYNTVYTGITTYRTSVFNSSLQSTLSAKATAVSNSAVVSASANAGAGNMSHSITVNQMASGVNLASSGAITTGTDKNTLADQFGLGTSAFNIKITNNGVTSTIAVDPTKSINTFVAQINSAVSDSNSAIGMNLNANYDTTLDRFFLTTTNTGASASIDFSGTADPAALTFLQDLKINTAATTKVSGAPITTGTTYKPIPTLAQQFTGLTGPMNIQITNAGQTQIVPINTATDTMDSLVAALNNAGVSVTAKYDSSTDRFTLTDTSGIGTGIDFSGSDAAALSFLSTNLKLNTSTATPTKVSGAPITTGAAYKPTTLAQQFTGLTGPMTIQIATAGQTAQTISIDPTKDTMDSLVSKLSNAGANVTASYDSSTDLFALTDNSGTGSGIDFSGSNAAALSFLGTNLKLNTTKLAQTGSDAIFNLDGVNNLAESSNSFAISGVTYTLASQGSSTVSVSTDVNSIVAAVQSFVTSYNTELASVYAKVTEPAYSDYPPLTSAQESSMSQNDITLWNAKAQSGMLNNDNYLTSLVNNMRDNMYTPVSGLTTAYNSAAALGITTGDYTQNGQLTLDTDTLKAALAADPNAAYEVFGSKGSSTDSNTQGIAVRLTNTLQTTQNQITQEAGIAPDVEAGDQSFLATEINNLSTQMSDENTRLSDVQSRYYNEFNAMETAIQQLNSQSSWLSSMLGTSSTSSSSTSG